MDRLDRLTQRLLEELDRHGDRPSGPDCLRLDVLGRLATGGLDAQTREPTLSRPKAIGPRPDLDTGKGAFHDRK